MATESIKSVNAIKFNDLCKILDRMSGMKKKVDSYKVFLDYLTHLKIKIPKTADGKKPTMFPLLRLLLPKLERERPAYNLKEKALGSLLISVLALSKKSPDAKRLLNFTSHSNNQMSDFASVACFVLKHKVGIDIEELTIGDINEALDKIATHAENRSTVVNQTFSSILKKLKADQLKWFFRIILKDMSLKATDNQILSCYYPDAPEIYKTTNSLRKVCEEFEEDDSRPVDLGVQLYYAVTPMLSERLDVSDVQQQLSSDKVYHIEKKFDGERFQIHMKDGNFKYFSKKGYSHFTKTYGSTYDEGLLTPFLKNCLNTNVSSFVIDGEMMGWHKELRKFGSKSMPYDIKKVTENSKMRPCFCAFDILYYNDKSLVGPPESGGLPLNQRLPYLDDLFQDIEGVIQHSVRRPVNGSTDILEALKEAMDNDEEGIVVKDTQSYYLSSQRKGGWYKIKPEYTEGVLADLDFVIIGGDESADKTHGRINSFLVACLEPSDDGSQRWLSVSHVSNGLSYEERKQLCDKLEVYWKRTADHPPPDNLVLNKCKTDFWIEPENSVVLQVHATELVRSKMFGTPYTLQFPRVVRVRNDKPIKDTMTIEEFNGLIKNHSSVIKLAVNEISEDQMNKPTVKSPRKRQKKVLEVAEQFRINVEDTVEVISNALEGRKIYILSDEEDCSRQELTRIIQSHGGTVVPTDDSCWCVLVGRMSNAARSYLQQRRVRRDVVPASWVRALPPVPLSLRPLRSCRPPRAPPAPRPLDLLASTTETRLQHAPRYDIFGDSYTEPIDKDTLLKCFDKMETMPKIHPMHDEMLELDKILFEDENRLSFLRPCVIHIMEIDDIDALFALMFGASICDINDPSLTHISVPINIIYGPSPDVLMGIKKDYKHLKLVSENWLKKCIREGRMIDEQYDLV